MTYLESDRDLITYLSICKSTFVAVNADNLSFWRRRFLEFYEQPLDFPSNVALKQRYKNRRWALKHGARFSGGTKQNEQAVLLVLRDLILGEKIPLLFTMVRIDF